MDQLKKFLMAMPVTERQAFAARCGTSYAFLRNVVYGQRTPGEKLCVAIWRESGGVVTRQVLRPSDWQDIWPELAQQKEVA
ncbi:helix-turn-helix domain-containing protein [Burkholderia sp. JSH-S8]|nr:helix-turn-helix domain-containing protein [Burkholderia sp. JSH-S8]